MQWDTFTLTLFTHITLMGWANYHSNQAPPLGVWEVFKWSVGNVVFREVQKAGECESQPNHTIQSHQH